MAEFEIIKNKVLWESYLRLWTFMHLGFDTDKSAIHFVVKVQRYNG